MKNDGRIHGLGSDFGDFGEHVPLRIRGIFAVHENDAALAHHEAHVGVISAAASFCQVNISVELCHLEGLQAFVIIDQRLQLFDVLGAHSPWLVLLLRSRAVAGGDGHSDQCDTESQSPEIIHGLLPLTSRRSWPRRL